MRTPEPQSLQLMAAADRRAALSVHNGVVTSIIIGAKNKEQLFDNLAATEVKLSAEHLKQLHDASAAPEEYPGWMVGWQNHRVPRGHASGRKRAIARRPSSKGHLS